MSNLQHDPQPRPKSWRGRIFMAAAVASMLLMLAAAMWLRGYRQEVQVRIDVLAWGGDIDVRDRGPSWLGRLLDPRYAEEVIHVRLINTNVTAADLERLSAFDALEELVLYQSSIGDDAMPIVAKLDSVRRLNLYRTDVTEAGLVALKNMPRLEEIWIGPQTSIREFQALSQISSLTTINVNGGKDIDERALESLKQLPSLEAIRISGGCSISPEAQQAFRAAKPGVVLHITDQ